MFGVVHAKEISIDKEKPKNVVVAAIDRNGF